MLFNDEPGLLEETQVARDAGLREAENAGQFLDVEAVLVEHAQQAEARLVAKQPVESGRAFHIYKSICSDANSQVRAE